MFVVAVAGGHRRLPQLAEVEGRGGERHSCPGADDVGSPRLLLVERRRQPAVVVTEWRVNHAERAY
jgi:hypothetical protein